MLYSTWNRLPSSRVWGIALTGIIGLPLACSEGSSVANSTGADSAGAGGSGEAGGADGVSVAGAISIAGTGGLSTAGASGSGGQGGAAQGGGGAANQAGANNGGNGGQVVQPPPCEVPGSGGEDFADLLAGPKDIGGEDAELHGAAAVIDFKGTGWTGEGFADMVGSEGGMTWLIDAPAKGSYLLTWTYTQTENRDMRLEVNCDEIKQSVAFNNTGSWDSAWVSDVSELVRLEQGTNQIVLETNGGSGPNFDKMTITPPLCTLVAGGTSECEAEGTLLSGMTDVANVGSGFSGDGYADMLGGEGAVNWVIEAPFAGTYTVIFTHTQDDDRDMTLSVNGVELEVLSFSNTGSWDSAWASDTSLNVELRAGHNSLVLATNGGSGPNFDKLSIEAPASGPDAGAPMDAGSD